jgi:hypothetical protein
MHRKLLGTAISEYYLELPYAQKTAWNCPKNRKLLGSTL